MKRAPYTECKLYVDGAEGLAVGDFIVTTKSAYLVQTLRINRNRPYRKHMQCLRWPLADVPSDARCFVMTWYRR